MIQEIINGITTYFYVEYTLAIVAITLMVRFFYKGIDQLMHPKWVTLIVAVLLAIVGYSIKMFEGQAFHFFKVVTSFGAATLGYDYFVKVLKDKFTL